MAHIAAAGTIVVLGSNKSEFAGQAATSYLHNTTPAFAAISSVPGSRFVAIGEVYVVPSPAYMAQRVPSAASRALAPVEDFDVLPAELTLTYDQAVTLGKRVTMLVRDASPEIDLGSAR